MRLGAFIAIAILLTLTAGQLSAQTPPTGPATAAAQARQQWFQRAYKPASTSLGSLDPASGYRFSLELTSAGAAVRELRLADHYQTVRDKRQAGRCRDDFQKYLQMVKDDPALEGNYLLLSAVGSAGAAYVPFATASVTVSPQGLEPYFAPVEKMRWQLLETSEGPDGSLTAGFAWTLLRDVNYDDPSKPEDARPFLRLTKTYTVRKGEQSVQVSLRVENLSELDVKVSIDQFGPTGVQREDVRSDARRAAWGLVQDAQKVDVQREDMGALDKMQLAERRYVGASDDEKALAWIGFVNKFFGSMMYLVPRDPQRLAADDYRAKYYVAAVADGAGGRTYLTGVEIPELAVAPGQEAQATFSVFAGPKTRELFTSVPEYKKLNYLSTIDLKSCCSIDWLTLGLMWLLSLFAKVLFGNYGLAIILLVVLMRLALHPLTKKGQVSMMKMQKLGPKMQELKQKYADDKDTLQREMMKVTREQGATPILGCAPMLLQLPIWVALWTGLNAEVALRQAAFLPVWLTDLATPDAIVSWSSYPLRIPLVSGLMGPIVSLNLLPVLLTVAMYFQTKLNPSTAPTSPEQASQQKIMKVMMPAMMLLFFYNAPSGLTLYIMTSTASGVLEQMVIRKHIKEKEAAEAAVETRVAVPGKGPRGSRPKKPKGPFWLKRG